MHVTLFPAVMLALSTIITVLSLLLVVLERRPQGRHTAAGQPPGLDQLSPGRRERDKARLAVQRAVQNRRGEAPRRLAVRRRKIILGSLPPNDAAEDERDQDREAFQGWESSAPTAANGQTNG